MIRGESMISPTATAAEMRQVAAGSAAAISDKHDVVDPAFESCQIIWDELVQEFMPVPTEARLTKVISDFSNRLNFPIDEKHCQVKFPPKTGSACYNYLKYHSVMLQDVAEADKKYFKIELGGEGKQSDEDIFAGSRLFEVTAKNEFNVPCDQELPGINVTFPNVMICDEAHHSNEYLT
jgi:hypothetical protein